MECPRCQKEIAPEAVIKRVCPHCDEALQIGGIRWKVLVAGLAVGGYAGYAYLTREDGGWLGIALLGMISLLLILRSRR